MIFKSHLRLTFWSFVNPQFHFCIYSGLILSHVSVRPALPVEGGPFCSDRPFRAGPSLPMRWHLQGLVLSPYDLFPLKTHSLSFKEN